MARRSSPLDAADFADMVPRPDEWDLVIKVKYGDTLKRFNGCVHGSHFDQTMAVLRAKIISAFKFSPDADFVLTYTDEDGDVVMLDDDDDLRDAAIHQKLNPLRINVQLKSSNGGTSEAKEQASNSTPLRSSPLVDPIAQMKSSIDEALKSLPEPVPSAFLKISDDLLSKAASSAGPFVELLDHFSKLMAANNSNQPSNRPMDGSSGSSSGLPNQPVSHKSSDEPKVSMNSDSRPSHVPNSSKSSKPTKAKVPEVEVPRGGLVEAVVNRSAEEPRDQRASGYPSIEELLFSSCPDGNNIDRKESSDAQCKGKSVMPSGAPPVPSMPFMGEWSRRHEAPKFSPSICPFESTGTNGNDCKRQFPFVGMPPVVPAHSYIPFKAKTTASSPNIPYPGRLLSAGHPYRYPEDNHESMLHTFHRWIQCDGCGMQPIVGPRYKSKVKDNYDLCSTCFSRVGNEADYTRIDRPIIPGRTNIIRDTNMRRIYPRVCNPLKPKREKLESRFILDVTVLDGTSMAPGTPFTKIWRMRNNGTTLWPFGTQLVWVGGDYFAIHSSSQLEIPVSGFGVDEEIDIAVDFTAPSRPGRYISYWRLASPSGQKFGQRVWVLIQVEQPNSTHGNIQSSSINLNLPPENSSTSGRKHLIDVNADPMPIDSLFGEFSSNDDSKAVLLKPLIHEIETKESKPASSDVPPMPAAVPAVLNPIIDLPPSSSTSAPAASVPLPEPVNVPIEVPVYEPVLGPGNVPIDVPVEVPINVPVEVPVNAPVLGSVSVPTPEAVNKNLVEEALLEDNEDVNSENLVEEALLKELEEMGFKQVSLNKEVLRHNKYNLEQSLDDLCGFSDWDPLLTELQEMGFEDPVVNRELLEKNGGSIKRAVMDLVAREKKDQ